MSEASTTWSQDAFQDPYWLHQYNSAGGRVFWLQAFKLWCEAHPGCETVGVVWIRLSVDSEEKWYRIVDFFPDEKCTSWQENYYVIDVIGRVHHTKISDVQFQRREQDFGKKLPYDPKKKTKPQSAGEMKNAPLAGSPRPEEIDLANKTFEENKKPSP